MVNSSGRRTRACRGCGAPIVFIKSARNGKMLPVNPTLVKYEKGNCEPGTKLVTEDGYLIGAEIGRAGYVPHWATCPKADDFRKHGTSSPRQNGKIQPSKRQEQ